MGPVHLPWVPRFDFYLTRQVHLLLHVLMQMNAVMRVVLSKWVHPPDPFTPRPTLNLQTTPPLLPSTERFVIVVIFFFFRRRGRESSRRNYGRWLRTWTAWTSPRESVRLFFFFLKRGGRLFLGFVWEFCIVESQWLGEKRLGNYFEHGKWRFVTGFIYWTERRKTTLR